MEEIGRPHIESFNYAMSKVLDRVTEHLMPAELESGWRLWIENLQLVTPSLYPTECRLRRCTYTAPLIASFAMETGSGAITRFRTAIGEMPIMVLSRFCLLSPMTIEERSAKGEDLAPIGGYFIINGIEKLVRMLIIQRKHYPIAISRPSFQKRSPDFTPLAVIIRCVRDDFFSQTITLHYLCDGNAMLRFIMRKGELLIPAIVLLKCLKEVSDMEIYSQMQRGQEFVEVLLLEAKTLGVTTQESALRYVGSKFRAVLKPPESMTDRQIGELMITEYIFVHLEKFSDKFNLMILMLEKLYALAKSEISVESLDGLNSQEFILPGQLYLMLLREKIEEALDAVKGRVAKEGHENVQRFITQHFAVGRKLEFFISTGNLKTSTGLDVNQTSGFTITAERINFARYCSFFRSVHRGNYFTQMKITSVRKLLPESWGFICPVHTPDGEPCGLLQHIASGCYPIPSDDDLEETDLVQTLALLGMSTDTKQTPIVLNGRIVGYTNSPARLARELRLYKIQGQIPEMTEIALVVGFQILFIASQASRLMRRVRHLETGKETYIGVMEQLNLSIACFDSDIRDDTKYQEIKPLNILNELAHETPFSDHNQSPRNMYQCQMAKQTMGTAFYNNHHRADNKSYQLTYPQKAIVGNRDQGKFGYDGYPSGTNAIVAVIAYTGYDMEDGMIVNKASYERGLAHGTMYKSKFKRLNENSDQYSYVQSQVDTNDLDRDGMPFKGSEMTNGVPETLFYNKQKMENKMFNYKDTEPCFIDDVVLLGSDSNKEINLLIKERFKRNPVIGDKFSSRHGQKGILSMLWPQQDMPFTETGITPDIIINPHAFPSRMTIGMLIESIAGKSGASHGYFQDSQPFQTYYNDSAVDYFGKELAKAGYEYYGNETMYSGTLGTQMTAQIFIGVVYYQRLRHMVADKYQARATGPNDKLTNQPVKGRKIHGGIRVGEMERDSLIAHGASAQLYDRLMHCSDYSTGKVCRACGSILGNCCEGEKSNIALPYVLRYLTNELAGMNIKLSFTAD